MRVVQRGIFERPRSPYLKLLRHAGVDSGEMRALVDTRGVEGALQALHAAGVYVTIDEFKGRRPLQRGSLRIDTEAAQFDNPLLERHYRSSTGGSRGVGRRLRIDLDLLARESAYIDIMHRSLGLRELPLALWRPAPFASAGLNTVLRMTKLGRRPERWFSQTRPDSWKATLLLQTASQGGTRFCLPEYTPADEALKVAQWLSDKVKEGCPVLLDTTVSSSVRICLAAKCAGIDISGTVFRLGGEPFTRAKAEILAGAGTRAVMSYSMSEAGLIAVPCGDPQESDDCHFLEDKLAVIPKPVDLGGATVEALFYTTLAPECPKLMLNVESGDYAVMEVRDCGCPFGAFGFRRHVHTIRSYEKLCCEGMCFLGTDLLQLLDEVLPGEFGGHPGDYQLMEEEEGAFTRVALVASPRLGELDGERIIRKCLEVLGNAPGGAIMTQIWRDGGSLRLVRRDPAPTLSGKVQPLHFASRNGRS